MFVASAHLAKNTTKHKKSTDPSARMTSFISATEEQLAAETKSGAEKLSSDIVEIQELLKMSLVSVESAAFSF